MRSYRRRRILLWLSSIIMLIVMLLNVVGCNCNNDTTSEHLLIEPAVDIVIENQTDQVLTIYVDSRGNPTGIVEPGKSVTTGAGSNSGRYLITAKNAQGEIVFSETYTFMPEDKYHLQKTDEVHKGVVAVYKAVIPPLQNN